MAVCPLILIFLPTSSQKWIVFANFLFPPNFLPRLANLGVGRLVCICFSQSFLTVHYMGITVPGEKMGYLSICEDHNAQ